MKSASDIEAISGYRFLVVGRTGSGKTTQIWTLPGRKFAYLFDPNSIRSLRGCPDLDYEEFYPDFLELDATLKGFNKGAKDDKPGSKKEPTVYNRWVEHLNNLVESNKLTNDYQWLVIDSMTFLTASVMARQTFINGRYGAIEELGDFRVVGSKIASVFQSIAGLPINIYATGHISTYQDDKTAKIETQLRLPGSARDLLPLLFTEVLQARFREDQGKGIYEVRTRPDPRGLEDIRTSIPGLAVYEDVTVKDFSRPTESGIGGLLTRATKVRSN